MKKILSLLNKKNIIKFFIGLMIIIWFWIGIFVNNLFFLQLKSIPFLFKLYIFNDDQKYELIDGKFYKFMRMCVEKIPEDSDVVFDTYPTLSLYSRDWYLKEYYAQKAPHYLYPRRIFRKQGEIDRKEGYKIVYNSENKGLYLYYKDKLISNDIN